MTVSAATLCQAGVSYPVAIEIARRAGAVSTAKLVAAGLPHEVSTHIKKTSGL